MQAKILSLFFFIAISINGNNCKVAPSPTLGAPAPAVPWTEWLKMKGIPIPPAPGSPPAPASPISPFAGFGGKFSPFALPSSASEEDVAAPWLKWMKMKGLPPTIINSAIPTPLPGYVPPTTPAPVPVAEPEPEPASPAFSVPISEPVLGGNIPPSPAFPYGFPGMIPSPSAASVEDTADFFATFFASLRPTPAPVPAPVPIKAKKVKATTTTTEAPEIEYEDDESDDDNTDSESDEIEIDYEIPTTPKAKVIKPKPKVKPTPASSSKTKKLLHPVLKVKVRSTEVADSEITTPAPFGKKAKKTKAKPTKKGKFDWATFGKKKETTTTPQPTTTTKDPLDFVGIDFEYLAKALLENMENPSPSAIKINSTKMSDIIGNEIEFDFIN